MSCVVVQENYTDSVRCIFGLLMNKRMIFQRT